MNELSKPITLKKNWVHRYAIASVLFIMAVACLFSFISWKTGMPEAANTPSINAIAYGIATPIFFFAALGYALLMNSSKITADDEGIEESEGRFFFGLIGNGEKIFLEWSDVHAIEYIKIKAPGDPLSYATPVLVDCEGDILLIIELDYGRKKQREELLSFIASKIKG